RAPVAAEDVASDADREGLAARRSAEADEPAHNVALCRDVGGTGDLWRRDRPFHGRRLHRHGRLALCGNGHLRDGRRGGRAARLGHRRSGARLAEAVWTHDRNLRLTILGGTVRTEVPRLVDEVPVLAALVSHYAWYA